MPTDAEIDAAAKVFCCGDERCIPDASYCALTHHDDRDFIRRMLEAAEKVRTTVNG